MDIRLQQGSKGWFAVVDYIIILFAILANCFALHSVYKSHFGLKAYRRFLLSLVLSDLYVCGIHLLNFANQALADHLSGDDVLQPCVTNFLRGLLIFGVFANLYNLCGMSIDHYIGIIYPMRYSYITSHGLAKCSALIVWLLAFCCGFADVPVVSIMYFVANSQTKSYAASNTIPHSRSGNCSIPQPIFDLQYPTPVKSTRPERAGGSYLLFRREQSQAHTSRTMNVQSGYSALPDLDRVDLLELRRIIQDTIGALTNSSMFKHDAACEDESQAARESQFMREFDDFQQVSDTDRESANNWCLFSNSRKIWLELFVVFCILVCLLFLVVCYGKLFKTVALNIRERSVRKLVMTTCLLIGNFTICWCPFMFFEITMWAIVSQEPNYQNGPQPESLLIAHNIINTLFLSHPLVDPIVYVMRLPNVQKQILASYSWLWCHHSCLSEKEGPDCSRKRSCGSQGATYSLGCRKSATRNSAGRHSAISYLNEEQSEHDHFEDSPPLALKVPGKHYFEATTKAWSSGDRKGCGRRITAGSALERVSSNVLEYLREESAYNRQESDRVSNNASLQETTPPINSS